MTDALVEVRDLVKHFPLTSGFRGRRSGAVRAVDGVSFDVLRGETLGLVGESGCGKTTTARLLLRLLEPTSGSVRIDGREVAHAHGAELRALRREVQMIFQDPFSSLNPRRSIGAIINRYPHESSGGQRQRVGVARALALSPKLIVADEPVSALDVSIQAQILNLLRDLQRDLGLTLVFIAHDLSVVRHMCDRVAVMYLGKIAELADADALFAHPRMPYTGALMAAVPVPDPELAGRPRPVLAGDVPSPSRPPAACRFHTRCWKAQERCALEEPVLEPKAGGNLAACHFPLTDEEIAARIPTAGRVAR
jgi:peptide/nickel transport system ATP-binding protein/oligopeptide transport system ATP-binding protein